jgi:flagella basal body P-ring formation protein FlgA
MKQRAWHRAVIGLLLGLPLAAVSAQAIEPLQRIQSVAQAAAAAQLPPSAQVSANGLDARLRLAECEQSPQADPPSIRGATATVTVRCSAPAWTVYVAVRVSDLRPVVVLTRGATRGDLLDASMMELQERDVAQMPFGYIDTLRAGLGLQLRRTVPAGTALTPNDVEAERLVHRGDIVTVLGRAGGLEVRTSGKAMNDGAQGERVRVQNVSSKRIVEGVVSSRGVVEIRL